MIRLVLKDTCNIIVKKQYLDTSAECLGSIVTEQFDMSPAN